VDRKLTARLQGRFGPPLAVASCFDLLDRVRQRLAEEALPDDPQQALLAQPVELLRHRLVKRAQHELPGELVGLNLSLIAIEYVDDLSVRPAGIWCHALGAYVVVDYVA